MHALAPWGRSIASTPKGVWSGARGFRPQVFTRRCMVAPALVGGMKQQNFKTFGSVCAVVSVSAAVWKGLRNPLPDEASAGQSKTVLVTGGTTGLGLATVQRLAKRGDHVITCGRNAQRVAEVNQLPNVTGFVCDLAKEDDIEQFVYQVKAHLGERPLDALVNNAGASRGGDPVLAIRTAELDAAWNLNVRAVAIVTRDMWPLLTRSETPLIINVGSTCSHPKFAGAFSLTYPLTKAALRSYSNSLRQEVSLLKPSAQVVHLTTGAFQTGLTTDVPKKYAEVLSSYGPPFADFAEVLHQRTAQGFALLKPKCPDEFAASVAALVHPVTEHKVRLSREYRLNVSTMERVVPWVPQGLLDYSWVSDCKGRVPSCALIA